MENISNSKKKILKCLEALLVTALILFGGPAQNTFAQNDPLEETADNVVNRAITNNPLKKLSYGERVALIRGAVLLSANEFVRIARESATDHSLDEPLMQKCGQALSAFAGWTKATPGDVSELEEIAAEHGFDPAIANDTSRGINDVADVAAGAAETLWVAQQIALGREDNKKVKSWMVNVREGGALIRYGSWKAAEGLPFGLSEQLYQQNLEQMFDALVQQTQVVTSIICMPVPSAVKDR